MASLETAVATWSLHGILTLSLAFDEFWEGPFQRCPYELLLHELAHHEAFHHGRSLPREVEAYADAAVEVMLDRGDKEKRFYPHLLTSRAEDDDLSITDTVILNGAQVGSQSTFMQRLRSFIQEKP